TPRSAALSPLKVVPTKRPTRRNLTTPLAPEKLRNAHCGLPQEYSDTRPPIWRDTRPAFPSANSRRGAQHLDTLPTAAPTFLCLGPVSIAREADRLVHHRFENSLQISCS